MLDYCFGLSGSNGSKDFGRPEFSFYDDTSARIGAKALRGGAAGCHIYFGLLLINDEMGERPLRWESVVSGFLAHEWAHAFQYKSALDEKTFLWETHADYLAGWYLGVKKIQGGRIDPSLFQQILYRKGATYFSENAYGLPQQRFESAEAGVRFALSDTHPNRRPDVSLAAEAGYDYVSAMRAKALHP